MADFTNYPYFVLTEIIFEFLNIFSIIVVFVVTYIGGVAKYIAVSHTWLFT